jgi:hypothetical protein
MPAPNSLPVEQILPELLSHLADRRNAVLVAPPGAGKSTVVPLALLRQPWAAGKRLLLLEPRRLAARAVAARMAAWSSAVISEAESAACAMATSKTHEERTRRGFMEHDIGARAGDWPDFLPARTCQLKACD